MVTGVDPPRAVQQLDWSRLDTIYAEPGTRLATLEELARKELGPLLITYYINTKHEAWKEKLRI